MQAPFYAARMSQSQPVSQFIPNLNARRESLGLDVKDVAAELNRRGFPVAYPTVAGWFNGNRGKRWDVDELAALLDILKTDLQTMAGKDAVLVETKVPALAAIEMEHLPEAQQQAILAMIRTMRGSD